MPNRIFNFSAGPCTLPLSALEKARSDFVDYQGAGMSLIEMSHRGKHYDEVHYEAIASIREVLKVPESHDILFIQGGATLQFAMVPLNLMADGKIAEFVNTGTWVKKAIADAETKQLLGVIAVGRGVSELIGEATLALEMGAFLEDVGLTIHAHPTMSEAFQEAVEAALGKAVHQVNK